MLRTNARHRLSLVLGIVVLSKLVSSKHSIVRVVVFYLAHTELKELFLKQGLGLYSLVCSERYLGDRKLLILMCERCAYGRTYVHTVPP